MEQNKILNKPFKQTFHFTDIRHNIIGITFITKYIPTINILNSKIHIKDKYTRDHGIDTIPTKDHEIHHTIELQYRI